MSFNSRKTKTPIYDTAIIGSGLHGTHIALRLLHEKVTNAERILLIDPHPVPCHMWHIRAQNCGMDFLRSPASHGIAEDFQHIRRLHTQKEWNSPLLFAHPYHRPSIMTFSQHLHKIQKRLSHTAYLQGIATNISKLSQDFLVSISTFQKKIQKIRTRTVVLALGQSASCIPSVFAPLVNKNHAVQHIYAEDFSLSTIKHGDHVLIIGNGIASVHIALLLAKQNIRTVFWSRTPIRIHRFDSDPCFIGPRCAHIIHSICNIDDKEIFIQRSRRTGSIPYDLFHRFEKAVNNGHIEWARKTVTSAAAADGRMSVSSGIHTLQCDRVILATGFQKNPPSPVLLSSISRTLHLPRSETGYPITDSQLSWTKGLFVTGGLADLILGPPARNIIGAHLAGRRIIPSLTQHLHSTHERISICRA